MTPRQPKPVFRLTQGGRDITARVLDNLHSLTLTDNRGFEADQLDVVLDDSDGKLDIPPRGALLSLALGWEGSPLVDKGSYMVDEVEHHGAPDVLTIRARSADLRAGLATKKERSWHRTTVGQLVRGIAKEAKLTPAITPALEREVIDHIDQTSESDISLLQRVARMFDACATVKNGRLLFIKMGTAITPGGQPLQPVQLARQDGDHHRFSICDREAFTAVRAYFHDVKGATKGEVLEDGTKRKKGDKRIAPSSDNVKTLRHVYASKTNATRAAKAAWDHLQRGVAKLDLTLARGRPELFPELPARVSGFKPVIDATDWLVTKATHRLEVGGFTTVVEMEVRAIELDGHTCRFRQSL